MKKQDFNYCAPESTTIVFCTEQSLLAGSPRYGQPGAAGDYDSDEDEDYGEF